ncbi:MAG: NosD domain-containing protein [Candidatus Limnocylindria bacterium]
MRRTAGAALVLTVAIACQGAAPLAQPSSTSEPPAWAATPAPTPTPLPAVSPKEATCGQVITADFLLANDLTCARDALVAGADGITIDLGGRLLRGPGMGPQTWPAPQLDSVAVRAEGRRGITVRNGRLTDFSTGVYFRGTAGSVIEDVRSERSRYGLYLHESSGNTVRRSMVEANIYGLHLQYANDNLVQGNQLVRQTYNSPGGYGIYLFASERNRIVENTIEDNVNWGIWFSQASGNLIYHNNVAGNRPQVSDNTQGNVWHDETTKQGNYWGDYPGRDGDGDLIGDSPYVILGPANVVDRYPFVERDGWKKKSRPTVDHYRPPLARAPRSVTLVALAGGNVYTARPDAERATFNTHGVSSLALSTDERRLYALHGQTLLVQDLADGAEIARSQVNVADGIVAANRDGESILVVGPSGAEQLKLDRGEREYYAYRGEPQRVAPSYKHNHIFVSSPRGITLLYLNLGGRTPYTIPLDGAAGAMAMNGSGTRVYAVAKGTGTINVVDTEQYRVVDRIRIGAEATALAVSPREDTLYVGTAAGVTAIDLATNAARGHAPALGTIADLAVSPNGDQVYAALGGVEHAIAVLRASDLGLANLIRLDAAPVRLLVAAL